MSKLDFEQRHRLETEVLPAVIDDPEYAAATIVRLEAERDRLREALAPLLADYEEARKEWSSPDTEIYADHLIEEARAAITNQPPTDSETDDCVACEGKPAKENNPCFVCGRVAP